ncbi:hypothetical protein HDV05_000029 [Chytridiales sp. JEL 0842]|nr:hypothetical protein HDV05_000029 [Chytridiales sp. JEL 0842]
MRTRRGAQLVASVTDAPSSDAASSTSTSTLASRAGRSASTASRRSNPSKAGATKKAAKKGVPSRDSRNNTVAKVWDTDDKENHAPKPNMNKPKDRPASAIKRAPFAELRHDSLNSDNILKMDSPSKSDLFGKKGKTYTTAPSSARTNVGTFPPRTPGTEIPIDRISSPKLSPLWRKDMMSDNEDNQSILSASVKRQIFKRSKEDRSVLSFGASSFEIQNHDNTEYSDMEQDALKSVKGMSPNINNEMDSDLDDPFGFAQSERLLEKKKTRINLLKRPQIGQGSSRFGSQQPPAPSPLRKQISQILSPLPPSKRRKAPDSSPLSVSTLPSDDAISPLAPGQVPQTNNVPADIRPTRLNYKKILGPSVVKAEKEKRRQMREEDEEEEESDSDESVVVRSKSKAKPKAKSKAKTTKMKSMWEDDFDSDYLREAEMRRKYFEDLDTFKLDEEDA